MSVGRPTKYKESYCNDVMKWLGEGETLASFADEVCCCTRDTLYEWARIHPEFSDAIKRGRARGERYWMNFAKENMVLPKSHSFQAAPWIFLMKNQYKWTDRVEHSGAEEKPIRLAYNLDKKPEE